MAKYIISTFLTVISMTLLNGCVTQSFENNEPIVKNQANRDEMAATRISLGLGYLKMGNMSQAKLNLEKAKKFSPNLVQVHTAFAHYYETVGEGKLAVESFEQALSIKADSADTLNNYGVFLCRQDKLGEAEVQFLKAIAVPSYLLVSESYENLASCYLQSGDFEKAKMYLNKSIYHSPNRASTLLKMVRLQYAMANYKESQFFLQKFERSTQRFTADSLSLAYKLYRKLGQGKTAGNYADMLVKMYPQSREGKQYLLNELALIDADNLAKKYQLTQQEQNHQLLPPSHKRVVKLSPRKLANTPYTSSVKTVIPVIKTTSAATAEVKNTVVPAPLALIKNSVSSTPGAKTVLLSTQITEAVSVINKPTDKITAAATEITVANEAVSHMIEATSTQPIAATRDMPLPESLPEAVDTEVVETELVATEAVETEVIEIQKALHTVIPGENLYSISVEYNVKIEALRKWNNLSKKNKIRIGDKLYVIDPQIVNNIND